MTNDNYIKFVLSNVDNQTMFRLDISVVSTLEDGDLPLPYGHFKNFFFALKQKMPKIIWMHVEKEETKKKQPEKQEEEETTSTEEEKTPYKLLNKFKRNKSKVKNRILNTQNQEE